MAMPRSEWLARWLAGLGEDISVITFNGTRAARRDRYSTFLARRPAWSIYVYGGFRMTAMRGGVIDEMHQMAKQWSAQAGQLRQLTNSLNSSTANSQAIWSGPGADKFRSEWQQCRAAFEKMATTLDDGSQAITKYANNIQAATAWRPCGSARGDVMADPAQIRAAAQQLRTLASGLGQPVSALTRTYPAGSIWKGPAADRFYGDLSSALSAIGRCASELERYATTLDSRASQPTSP